MATTLPGQYVQVLTLTTDEATCTIDVERGARLSSLTVFGRQLLVARGGPDDVFGWGSFAMAPWAGRIRRGHFSWDGVDHQLPINFPPHAIHGTAYGTGWEVVNADSTSVELSLELVEPWPFPGQVRQRIELVDAALVQQIQIHASEISMPASAGWHPWFLRDIGTGAPLILDVDMDGVRKYAKDADGIPSGELVAVPPGPWDDCFTGLKGITLRWPGALAIDVDHPCPYVVIYSEPDHALCVEPQTAPPDMVAIMGDGCRVDPGAPLIADTAWRWRQLT